MRRILVLAVAWAACGGDPARPSAAWPAPNPFPGVGPAGAVVATDAEDDTLSVVDVATHRRTYAAPVGLDPIGAEGPTQVLPSPDGRSLYVTLSNYVEDDTAGPHASHLKSLAPGFLLKLSSSDLREVARVPLRIGPSNLVLDRAGEYLYISHYNVGEVHQVHALRRDAADLDSYVARVRTSDLSVDFVPICAGGQGLALSSDQRALYVACTWSDQLAVLDLSSWPPPVTRVPIAPDAGTSAFPIYLPASLTVSPLDGKVWIANLAPERQGLEVYDPTTATMGPLIALPGIPTDQLWRGGALLLPVWFPDMLVVLEQGSLTAMPMDADCLRPTAIAAGQDSVFLLCAGSSFADVEGRVVEFDLATRAARQSTAVGRGTRKLLFLPPAVQ